MKKAADFASLRKEMGEDQWRRYRYVGPYAAYRGLLQSLGLLEAGGWNLTASGKALATVADKCARITLRTASIKRNAAPTDDTTGWVPYWLRRWNLPADSAGVSTFLPTDLTALAVAERKILAPALFKESGRRHDVAVSVGKSSAAQHSTLCKHLQKDLLRKPDWALAEREKLAKFGEFASLADTAVDALKAAFKIVAEHASGSPTLGVVAKSMAAELTRLRNECAEWKRDRVWPTVDAFAREIMAVNAPEHILRKLVRFHERQAGGLVWLRIRDGGLDRAVRNDQAPGG